MAVRLAIMLKLHANREDGIQKKELKPPCSRGPKFKRGLTYRYDLLGNNFRGRNFEPFWV